MCKSINLSHIKKLIPPFNDCEQERINGSGPAPGLFDHLLDGLDQRIDEEMILGKIKKTITKRNQNLNRELKLDEMKSLLVKLQIWRDRISNSFVRR